MLNMKNLSFIIFDLDDTLIHSNIDYAAMKNEILKLFNPQDAQLDTLTIKELLERLDQDKDKYNKAYKIIETIESKSALKAEAIPSADKIPAFLKESNLKAAILTNNSRNSVNKYLQTSKLQYLNNIGSIITRDDVSKMKPDPAGLLYIINKFKLKPQEVYFIGDSYIDAEAAKAANIDFLLVNYRNLSLSRFKTPPIRIFSQLSEIFPFLRKEIDCIF